MARRALTLFVVGVILAVGGACAGSGYQFVRNSSTGTYFKVPERWKVYGHKESLDFIQEAAASDDLSDRLPFVTTFDASTRPSVGFDPASDQPNGLAQVRKLTADERDQASLYSARNVLWDVDAGLEQGDVQIDRYEEVRRGELRGQRIVFGAEVEGQVFKVDQTTLLDERAQRIYILAVGCSVDCFDKNHKAIDKVVTSLTIKER